MGAEEIRPGFCLSCRVRKSRRHVWNTSDVSLSVSTGQLSQISCHRDRATKRWMLFVSDRADGYFVSSPLEWDCEVLLRKMFGKTWVWRLVI